MPDQDAFLQALIDDPYDSALAGVFADWLDERGDPRGEFLRVQTALARWQPPRLRQKLVRREEELLRRHRDDWLGPLGVLGLLASFERGLATIEVPPLQPIVPLARNADEWTRRAWVRWVRLYSGPDGQALAALAPALPGLDLSGNSLTDREVFDLLNLLEPGRLRHLDLSRNELTDRSAAVLCDSGLLGRLSWLDLGHNELSGDGVRQLLAAAPPGRLRLIVHGNELDGPALAALDAWLGRQRTPVRFPRRTNSLGMEFVRVPAGPFLMGSPALEFGRYNDEGPLHQVLLTEPYYLGVYPVTQEEYEAVMGSNPSDHREGRRVGPRHPVDSVDWHEAAAFCRRLGRLAEEKRLGHRYRLPTEAEWENACRAGTTTPFAFGPTLSAYQANFNGTHPYGPVDLGPSVGHTTPVGSYAPNAWGLYDLHGNVWEWCADRYGESYYEDSPVVDPQGPSEGNRRVLRGGSWYNDGGCCRSAYRYRIEPEARGHFGFRVVLVPGAPES